MRDKIIALLERHCGTIRSEADEIEACFQNFGPEPDDDQLQKTIYLVHKIKGSSGSLGFLPLSKVAHTLEYALRELDEKQSRDLALAEIHQLSVVLQDKILEMKPEASSLHQSAIMART